MRDIYLVDFENVASDGLSGITYLTEEDQVIIFYSNNSKSLSMKMHILIGKSTCRLSYFEATVGGKNALDHQISTWLGYLIGTGAGDRYFIVSRDMGYKFVANFWAVNDGKPKVYCADNIRGAIKLGRSLLNQAQQARQPDQPQETPPHGVFRQETGTDIPELETHEPEPAPPVQKTAEPETPASASETEKPRVLFQNADVQAAPAEKDGGLAEKTETPAAPAETEEAPEGNGLEVAIGAEEEPKETPRQPQRRQRKGTRRQEVSGRNGRKQEPKADNRGTKPSPQNQQKQQGQKAQQNQQNQQNQQGQKNLPNPQPKNQPGQQGKEKTPAKQEKPRTDQLHELIAPYSGLQENTLRELIQANKRQVLCNTLRKQLGQEKGLALYNEIKKSAWK